MEYLPHGMLVHQSTCTNKILKNFYMEKCHYLSTPIVRSLDVENDPFCPLKEGEMILGPEVPYLNAIGTLTYLANYTRPDIAFAMILLASDGSTPTKRHWKGVKHVLCYRQGTTDMWLVYLKGFSLSHFGYANARYLSDPYKGRSQTGQIFTCGDTTISWRLVKPTMIVTSSNYSITTIHKASREYFWLRQVIHHIQSTNKLKTSKVDSTITYEDNIACIVQL